MCHVPQLESLDTVTASSVNIFKNEFDRHLPDIGARTSFQMTGSPRWPDTA